MNASTDDLSLRLDREIDKRERANKYTHNMMEDLKQAISDFGIRSARFEGAFEQHIKDDQKTSATIDKVYADLKALTRIVYIGVGGVIILGGVTSLLGSRILTILVHG